MTGKEAAEIASTNMKRVHQGGPTAAELAAAMARVLEKSKVSVSDIGPMPNPFSGFEHSAKAAKGDVETFVNRLVSACRNL